MHRPVRQLVVAAAAAATLAFPVLGVPGVGAPAHAEPRAGKTAELVVDAHPDVVTARSATAPDRHRADAIRSYAVPTSAAGLGRITTGPDGAMWFTEADKNKIGRISTSGAITEFTLPAQTAADSKVKDIEVDASGLVWVVWDSGWQISRIDTATLSAYTWRLAYPYGEEVRVGPSAVWVTLSFDEDGILRIVGDNANWDANAPECDGALGRGRDGAMWCQQFDRLIKVNADGTGGAGQPLPSDATYPYSVATGPTARIWFGRDDGGTLGYAPARGNVGWVDSENRVRVIRTGDRTAPRSLALGRDGNVWFTSIGATKGIGHVNASGRGAVVKVGDYRPRSVTYGADGAIWFTDRDHNRIVRVTRDRLWLTNVSVGARSQLKPHLQPRLSVLSSRLDANARRTTARVALACGSGLVPCSGKALVKAGRTTLGAGSYRVAIRGRATLTVTLNATARRLLKRRSSVAVTLYLTAPTGQRVIRKMSLTR